MEKAVASLFTETIINEGLRQFEVDVHSAKMLGDFENFIYEGVRENRKVIVRYTHSSHRTDEQIISEIDWVCHLKKHGVNVYEHFLSKEGNFLEAVEAVDGSCFYICCYEMLPGKRITWRDCEQEPSYIEKWGAVIGQMHQATKHYVKPQSIARRPEWHEEDLMNMVLFREHYTEEMFTYSEDVLKQVHALTKTENNYGIIHSDLHLGNFHVQDDQVYVFDFDDSSYLFFASDIAIPLYYTILSRILEGQDQQEAFAAFFMKHFMAGYEKYNQLEERDLLSIPLFLRLRDVSLYNVMLKKFDLENLSEKDTLFMNSVKGRLKNRRTIAE